MPSTVDYFDDSRLAETARRNLGAGSDHRQPNDVRFFRGVASLVRKRLQGSSQPSSGRPAVFLLQAVVPEVVAGANVVEHPMLDNGMTPVVDQVWFVGPAVVSGKSSPHTAASDAELFHLIIDELKLGDVPAVIYDPRLPTPELRFYANGLADTDSVEKASPLHGAVTLSDVERVLNHIHKRSLVTPDAQSPVGKLWEKPAKYWVKDKAELTVQMYLITGLNVAFPTCRILPEQPGITGRIDIEIEEIDEIGPLGVIRHVLVELKVLRDFGSGGGEWSTRKTAKWIGEGIEQAHAYALERRPNAKALYCFDMRRAEPEGGCFSKYMRNKANELGVHLASWKLYASAKEYRAMLAAIGATSV